MPTLTISKRMFAFLAVEKRIGIPCAHDLPHKTGLPTPLPPTSGVLTWGPTSLHPNCALTGWRNCQPVAPVLSSRGAGRAAMAPCEGDIIILQGSEDLDLERIFHLRDGVQQYSGEPGYE